MYIIRLNIYKSIAIREYLIVNSTLNENTLGVKKVRGQSEATLQTGMCDQKL